MSYPDDLNEELDELPEDDATRIDANGDGESLARRRIFTEKSDPQVRQLFTDWQAGELILDPIFQRRKVWDDARSSRLIESVILDVPLPVFYLAENHDDTHEVIDGQQRLNAFFQFLNNGYSLRGLKARPDLNGSMFKDLDKPTQKQIRECSLRVVLFRKESDENLRFDIFERLNTGAVPLNAQELRNCVYRGTYNDLLHQLSAEPEYMKLMGLTTPEKRMKDVEYTLRFAAFYHATYLKYKPPMVEFLNEDMRTHRQISADQALKLKEAFKNSLFLVRSILGTNAFKRYYRGDAKSPDGRWEPRQFNAALYDILMWSFAEADKNQVMANLDEIREALIGLMTESQDFIDAIELSTSSVRMVRQRFDLWRNALDPILARSPKQPRLFPRALKQALYAANPTCAICGQQISDVDDAAVDHIEQYWLGGKTDPANARLAHRYCNWARPRNT